MDKNVSLELMSGLLVDQVIGDPRQVPHPVNFVAALATNIERYTRPIADSEREFLFAGTLMAYATVASTVLVTELLSRLGPGFRILLIASALAGKSLAQASRHVEAELGEAEKTGDLTDARKALSQYVGRDTAHLTETQIAAATVETVAENTCDGFVAPLFWAVVGSAFGHGPAFAWGYKAISTLDSMYGYKTEENMFYGRTSAKLDDLVAFIPARITAAATVAAAALCKENAKGSLEVTISDHAHHESPNAGWSEAAFAGALDVELGGPSVYRGTLTNHPKLNTGKPRPATKDIARARKLMYVTMGVASVALVGVLALTRKGR